MYSKNNISPLYPNCPAAKELYEFAATLPIIDYHNHLSAAEIADDTRFDNIYDLWIRPDPYKHRAMRMCGVAEKYITGDASPEEKFKKWCETVPRLIGNPLYIWTLAELRTVFGINEPPCGENAAELYEFCNTYLKGHTVSPSTLLKLFGTEFVCPCMSVSDSTDTLRNRVGIAPSLRCDDLLSPTRENIENLEHASGVRICSLAAYEEAIRIRLRDFASCGSVFSDIALDDGFTFYEDDGKNVDRFDIILNGGVLCAEDKSRLFSGILCFLGKTFAETGYVMQLHIGAQRYTSSALREKVGPAGGFAAIGNGVNVKSLTRFLDALDQKQKLPKTVLFTLNPSDNAVFSVLSGSYSRDGVSGLITQGPAWWWCDHRYGIREMLENAAAFGVLSNFVGMTTDSRSFLSFVRHDYFRRVLCDFLGEKFERNELGCSYEDLKETVYRMCYRNAKDLCEKHI